MARVRLIHWNAAEGEARAAELRTRAFDVELVCSITPDGLRGLRANPPDAYIIDLTRMPSHGREIATALRQAKSTRHIPIVFAGGAPEKVALIRARLPDAVYSEWSRIAPAVKAALRNPVLNPVAPPRLEGYTQSPLPKKLGIKPGRSMILVNGPEGFESSLEPLEAGQLRRGLAGGAADLLIVFVSSEAELEFQFPRAARAMSDGAGLWIAYPKRSSSIHTDLTQTAIREFGIALGLVDFKVCAIDETWTGLCFGRRKEPASRPRR